MKFLSMLFILAALGPSPHPAAAHAARATYEVPVPDALKPFATYSFDEISVREKGDGRIEVRYQLPLALTGEENHLRFEGPLVNGVAEMSNEQGAMICTLAEHMCRVKYKSLKIDAAKAEDALRAFNLGGNALAGHLAVTARFGGDMEGILISPEIR